MDEMDKVNVFVDQLRDGVHRKHAVFNGHRGARFSREMAGELLVALNKFARSMPIEKWSVYVPKEEK